MKKTILTGLVTFLTLGGASVALAHVESSTTTPRPGQQIKDVRMEAKSEIRDIRQNLSSTTQKIREQIKANIQDRVGNRFNKMIARYQSTIDRLLAIMDKLSSRIEKIKAAGGNTTEAEKLLADAKKEMDLAQVALGKLKDLADDQIGGENTGATLLALKEGLSDMKSAGIEVELHLRAAHKDLQKIIGVLRGVSQLKNASSTKETN